MITFMGISTSVTVYISSGSVSGVTTAGPSVEGPEGICPERRGFLVVQFVPLPLDDPQVDHPLLRRQPRTRLQRVVFPVLADS